MAADRPINGSAAQLRGFFANKFTEYPLLHQHAADGLIYNYPRVQYKIIDGQHTIIGINEGAHVLKELYDQYDSLSIGSTQYTVMGQEFDLKAHDFALSDKLCSYVFKTPWIALNQRNHRAYRACNNNFERRELLSRVLIGNILAIAKSFGYTVPQRINATVEVRGRKTSLKKVDMLAFDGAFVVNFQIPDMLGLGKSVSRGYGTVQRSS
jgi:hypothetical protein